MSDSDDLPRALAIAWGIETSPSRGPKRELSHESIIEAAIALASNEGVAAVTMARVAKSFGFTTMALYRYVSSKDDLWLLIGDRLNGIAAEALIDDTDWRTGLRDWTESIRVVYRTHPWLREVSTPPPEPAAFTAMPNTMRMLDNGLRAMRTLAVPFEEKLESLMRLATLARESVTDELAADHPAASVLSRAAIEAIQEVATPERFPDLHPAIADGSYFSATAAELADPKRYAAALDSELDKLATQAQGQASAAAPSADATPDEAASIAEREWRTAIALRKRAVAEVDRLAKVEGARQAEYEIAKQLAKVAAKARGATR